MHIIGIRANHRTVFLVHLLDLPDIGMALKDIVVRFMLVRRRSELRAGKLRQRVECEPVDREADVVCQLRQHGVE